MFEDNEEEFLPPKEEEIPARLAKKWEEREQREGAYKCPGCGKMILASSSLCPYCGDTLEGRRPWMITGAIVVIFIFILCGVRFLMHN